MKKQLEKLLNELQQELILQGFWQSVAPSESALASTEPFAIDTLSPCEWLQWIFIARLRDLLAQNQKLPSVLQISPYLAEALPSEKRESILVITKKIDALFT